MKENQCYIYYVDLRDYQQSRAAAMRIGVVRKLGFEWLYIDDEQSYRILHQLKEYDGFELHCV